MAAFSDYLEGKILRSVLNGQPFPNIPAVYLGLHLTAPTDDDDGLEVNMPSYVRIPLDFSTPDGNSVSNLYNINFPIATESWGEVAHFGIYDALEDGNLLLWGSFESAVTIDAGDTLRISGETIVVTVD